MRNDRHNLSSYFFFFRKQAGNRLYVVFILMLMAAFSEGLGIVMLIPLFEGIGGSLDVNSVPQGQAKTLVFNLMTRLGLSHSEVGILLLVSAAFLLKGLFIFIAQSFNGFLRGQLAQEFRRKLFDGYCRMTYQYYSSRDTGHFVNIINIQVDKLLISFGHFIRTGVQVVSMLVYLGFAIFASWRFGIIAIIAGIFVYLGFRLINRYVKNISRRATEEHGRLAKLMIQTLQAFKYLLSTDQITRVGRYVHRSIKHLRSYEIRRAIASAFTQSVREPIAIILIMSIVMFQLTIYQQPLAPIIVAIALFYRAFSAMIILQASWQATMSNIGSVEIISDELNRLEKNEEQHGSTEIDFTSNLHIKDTCFQYDRCVGDVIKNVSLRIPARSTAAFVGESGSGKSTLADLITLMLRPTSGDILIDGISASQINLASWRKQIGYVSQETIIFDDTVANNICTWIGDANSDAILLDSVKDAARQANIHEFIETLPDGYQTMVGDRGMRLSGGQRQRLFIARELFRRPNLLILDEATSALDSESELAIQKSIDALKGQITVVIIAHRLSTIRNVDRVYVFDKGRLVEEGGYQELRDAQNSRFSKLASLQTL